MKKMRKLLAVCALSFGLVVPTQAVNNYIFTNSAPNAKRISAIKSKELKLAIKEKNENLVIYLLQNKIACKNMLSLIIKSHLWTVMKYLSNTRKDLSPGDFDEYFSQYVYNSDDMGNGYPLSLNEFIYLTEHGYITDIQFHLYYICRWRQSDIKSYISEKYPKVTLSDEDMDDLIDDAMYDIEDISL